MIQYLNVFFMISTHLVWHGFYPWKLAALRLRAVYLARRLQPDAR